MPAAYAHVRDQRFRSRWTGLDDVERLPAVQHAQVGGEADVRDQSSQQRPAEPLQRGRTQVGRADLEGRPPSAYRRSSGK